MFSDYMRIAQPWSKFKFSFFLQFISYRGSWGEGEKLIKYQANSSRVIMSEILVSSLFYKSLLLHWEIWCWSCLGLCLWRCGSMYASDKSLAQLPRCFLLVDSRFCSRNEWAGGWEHDCTSADERRDDGLIVCALASRLNSPRTYFALTVHLAPFNQA